MRKFKLLIYAVLVICVLLNGSVLVWKLHIQKESPGLVVISVAILLLITAVFCAISAAAIDRDHGRLISKLWLFIVALAFFYIIADFLGGQIFIRPEPFHNFPDEYAHHKMPPRTLYVLHEPDSGATHEMTTNNLGFRGRDIEGKRAGVYRIVIAGDSFTMGDGLSDEHTFPYVLERLLNKPAGGRYEVINLGIVSYTPVLEYLLLKKYVGVLKPDMVVLNFDMSDPVQEYAYRKIASYEGAGDIMAVDGYKVFEERKSLLYANAFIWVRRNLYITSAILEILGRKAGTDDEADINVANTVERANRMLLMHTLDAPQLKESAEMHAMVEDSILRAKRLCDRHGCKFILSVYPWGHQVSATEWMPGRYDFIPRNARISDRTVEELGRFARENGITFFDAFPAFREYEGGEPLYFRHDMHWTPAGQRLMAESLAGFIEEDLKKGD